MSAPFLPGLELSRRYYREAVWPLIREHFGDLPHAAARVGSGSEVLGFDTARSADHEWGPRLQIFLRDAAPAHDVVAMLAANLPKSFAGYPTHFVPADSERVRRMARTDGPVHHRVDVAELGAWFTGHLGFDPRAPITVLDWLATPTQTLAEVTAGAVFHDGIVELDTVRARLAWYPTEVWRHILACQWQRISQEEAFVGRCGEVGDELGSAVVAARLVRDLMRLCLLMERHYPPYGKWLGSAFARLRFAADLTSVLVRAVSAVDWREREWHLVRAYETVAALHNALGITDPVDPTVRPYHSRPFLVLHAERFTAALVASITDPDIARLPVTGAVDQFVDSTDVLGVRERARGATRAVLAPGRSG